jgi:hypothetical protein
MTFFFLKKKNATTCHNFNGVTCCWRENLSVFDGKMSEGTISVFFHNQVPLVIKMKAYEAKNKNLKLHSALTYLTLKINQFMR